MRNRPDPAPPGRDGDGEALAATGCRAPTFTRPPSAPLALVADRFVRCGARAALDLASGQPVRLLVSDAGSAAQIIHTRSAARPCSAHGIHRSRSWLTTGPSIAQRSSRPGACRACGDNGRRATPRRAEALASTVRFLHAFGLSVGHLTWQRVVERDGCPVIVPDAATGLSLTRAERAETVVHPGDASIVARELSQLDRLLAACRRAAGPAIGGWEKAERVLSGGRVSGVWWSRLSPGSWNCSTSAGTASRGRCICSDRRAWSGPRHCARSLGRPGCEDTCPFRHPAGLRRPASGLSLTLELVVPLLGGRHVLVIDWDEEAAGRRPEPAGTLLLRLATANARPHVLLSVHSIERAGGLAVAGRTLWASGSTVAPRAADACIAGEAQPTYRVQRPGVPPPPVATVRPAAGCGRRARAVARGRRNPAGGSRKTRRGGTAHQGSPRLPGATLRYGVGGSRVTRPRPRVSLARSCPRRGTGVHGSPGTPRPRGSVRCVGPSRCLPRPRVDRPRPAD